MEAFPDRRQPEYMNYKYARSFARSIVTGKKYSGILGYSTFGGTIRLDEDSQLILMLQAAHIDSRDSGKDGTDVFFSLTIPDVCKDERLEIHGTSAAIKRY